MPQEQTISLLFSLVTVQCACCAVYYFVGTSIMVIQPVHIANLAFCGILQVMQLIFLVLSFIKCEFFNHNGPITYISQKINIRISLMLTTGVQVVQVVIYVTVLFWCKNGYSLWRCQYLVQLIKIYKQQQPCVRYSSYLLFLLVLVAYLSQLAIYTNETQYNSEMYFIIVLIILSLKIWWSHTPLLITILLIVTEIVDIQSTIKLLRITTLTPAIIGLQIFKLCLLCSHLLYTLGLLAHKVYKCVRQYAEVKDDMPMRPQSIELLQKVRLSQNHNISSQELMQVGMVEEVSRKELECTICTMEMPLGSFIYKIPCSHQYHSECLKNWLLVMSSCPTCRLRIK